MAKFDSNFTSDAPTGFSIQGGVVDQSVGRALGNIAGLADTFFAGKAKEQAAAAKMQQDAAVGGLYGGLFDIEQETTGVNEQILEMQGQIANEKDAGRVAQLSSQLDRLIRAEAIGANPATIKARQNSEVKKFIAANPHLAKEAMQAYSTITGLESVGDTGSGIDNPIIQAQNEMLKTAATGITFEMQIGLAQQKFQAESLKTQADMAAANGKLNFQHLYVLSKADSGQVATEVEGMIRSLGDPSSPDFQPIDGNAAKLALSQNIDQMVSQKMAVYVAQASEAGMALAGEQLGQLEKQVRGSVESAAAPYLDAMDEKNWWERASAIQKAKIEIVKNTTIADIQQNEPVMYRLQQLYGQDRAYTIAQTASRIIALQQSEKGTARLQTLMENDPDVAFAYQVMESQGLWGSMEAKMQNPTQPLASPALDSMATQANVAALQDGTLNQSGQVAVLEGVMSGNSLNNVRSLMSDKYYNKLRADETAQKALRNFTANSTEIVFGPMIGMIEDEGIQITFNPVPPTRIKDGSVYKPAEAFTVSSDDPRGVSPEVVKHVNKLNALYTLHGAFATTEELGNLGVQLSGFVDRNNPKFIERDSAARIAELEAKKERLVQKQDKLRSIRQADGGVGSIYDSPEERVQQLNVAELTNKANQAAIDIEIHAQRLRNPNDPLGQFPPGTVVDEAESMALGQTVYRLPDGQLVVEGE